MNKLRPLLLAFFAIVPSTALATPIALKPISVTASSTQAGSSPSYATDGNTSTGWNSGGYPTAWIQLDLGRTIALRKVRLRIGQSPSGYTSHRIFVGPNAGALRPVATLSGDTSDGQWLEFDGGERDTGTVRFIRIQTDTSPSWVSWNEIQVFQGMEYSGYFRGAFDGTSLIAETTSAGMNMVWLGGKPSFAAGLQAARAAGAKAVIDLDSLFKPRSDWSSGYPILVSNYEARWQQIADSIQPYQGSLAAFFLFDEPYIHCPEISSCDEIQRDLDKLVTLISERFPYIPKGVILSAEELDLPPETVAMFDWVGFDRYGEWFAEDMPGHIQKLEAMLTPSQRMIAVPWSFFWGDQAITNNAQDERIQNINEWHKEILSNARYVAVAPFMYHNYADPAGPHKSIVGARSLPWVKERVRQLASSLVNVTDTQIFAMDEGAPGGSWNGNLPFAALNRNNSDGWNAGASAPQNFIINLPGSVRLGRIVARVAQSPAGVTNHIIWGFKDNTWVQLSAQRGYTQSGNTVSWMGPPQDMSAIVIQTTESPSWIAWNEINMYTF